MTITTKVSPVFNINIMDATALAAAAAAMTSGQWSAFSAGGMDSNLLFSIIGSDPIITDAARGHYDAVHKELKFAASTHTGGAYIANAGGLVTYDELSNAWTREHYTWSSEDPGHGYYHNALNRLNGNIYFRSFNSATVYTRVYGNTGQTSWQTGLVANVLKPANQVASGLEWFPELNSGSGGLVFCDELGASYSNAALSSWTQQSGTSTSGPYQNWIAASGGFVYWGGGNGSTAVYRIGPTGTVTTMANSPLQAGVNLFSDGLILSHPNGTGLLLFGTDANGLGFGIYSFDGTSWSSIGTHSLGGPLWIGFTIREYGICAFLRAQGGNPTMQLYKP